MSMMAEIEKFMNSTELSIDYRIVNLGGKQLYIEGIKSVVNYGVDTLDFQLKKKVLTVKGYNLKVVYLDKSSCVIKGDISSVGVQ